MGVERLIAEGHKDPLRYTPKQLNAYIYLAMERKKEDLASLLGITRTAYHGEKKDVGKMLKELERGRI